jgi:hypothetical protein
MGSPRHATGWLLLQLGIGLLWAIVLAGRASGEAALGFTPVQVLTMLLLAGWLPSIALAAWQVRHRRWPTLILSDLLGAGLLVLLACTAYVPLFFVQVVWFLPYALLPRGVLSEIVMRLRDAWHKQR